MSGQILIGLGRDIHAVPDDEFVKALDRLPDHMASRLEFMSSEHHIVRDFVAREMPRQKEPISPRQIAGVTGLELPRVSQILEELEQRLFFLVRNSTGDVSWAFPVTTDRTAYSLSFSTGEKIFGA